MKSTLKLLEDREVVRFSIFEKDRRLLQVTEAMDYFKSTRINKLQLEKLIEELKSLHSEMKDK